VVKTGELPPPRWAWVPPVLITFLLVTPLVFGVFEFLTNVIEPVHRQIGQPFTIHHVSYLVENVVATQGKVVVTMHATGVRPRQGCAGVQAFKLDDDGHSYVEHAKAIVDGKKVSIPVSGCLNPLTISDPTWMITYNAPPGVMHLVVQAAGGFHHWGLDEYAVVSLKH
jgi:hypothetical protein